MNLRLLRVHKNLTQLELAKLLGCKQNTISQWENKKNEPNLEMLLKLANVFNVSVDEIIKKE